jgi:cytidylate kinase
MEKKIIVAIDGPAGAGKSTIARMVAGRLGCVYIDTGAMYRAVALWAIRNGTDLEDWHRLEVLAQQAHIEFSPGNNAVFLNGEDVGGAIRSPQVSSAASRVSAVPGVRRALVAKQQKMGETESVVMEGRDIGTVVFPNATVKIFLDADNEERARRRAEELQASGAAVDREAVRRDIEERDHRDRTRDDSPMAQAPDAIYLNSTGLQPEAIVEQVLRLVRERTSNGKERTH